MSPEQIIEQLQQIVGTLKRTIEASAELAERVEGLEGKFGETLGLLTSLQGNLQVLLEQYQTQAEAQGKLSSDLAEELARLEARVAVLEAL